MKTVSFESAVGLIERYAHRFDEMRRRAARGLTKSQAAVLDSIYELLTNLASIVKGLAHLESSLGRSSGFRRMCGNAALVSSQDGATFVRLKPLRAVTYVAPQGLVRIVRENLTVGISGDSITVSLGRATYRIPYLDPTDLASNAIVYRALLSKVLPATGELALTVASCAKAMGVKL